MTQDDLGLTFIRKPAGYPDVYVVDGEGEEYLITVIASCWLAAPVSPDSQNFSLYFKGIPPLKFPES